MRPGEATRRGRGNSPSPTKTVWISPGCWSRPIPRQTQPPLLIDAREACAMAGIAVSSWHRLVAARKAPAFLKVGGATRWRRAEIEQWIGDGCPAQADAR
jgi:predicted DNA-binding transcriptional regulator AlpA